MDNDIIFHEFTDYTCRVCLQNNEDNISLNNELTFQNETFQLKALLEKVTSHQIHIGDEVIPSKICSHCTNTLLMSYEFQQQVIASEKIIDNYKAEEDFMGLDFSPKKENEELNFDDDENENDNDDIDIDEGDDEDVHGHNELIEENLDYFIEEEKDDEDPFDDNSVEEDLLDNEAVGEDVAPINVSEPYNPEELLEEIDDEIQENDFFDNFDETSFKSGSEEADVYFENLKTDRPKRNDDVGSRLKPLESLPYQCTKCIRTFAKAETLIRHVNIAHKPLSNEQLAQLIPEPTKDRPIQCEICKRTFQKAFTYKRHLIAKHPEADLAKAFEKNKKTYDYKKDLCPFCGRRFTKSSLVIHIRRHTGEKPYKCTICGKGYPRKQDLTLHERYHTGEKPSICNICGKSFIGFNKLSRHMRIHTGSRPYKCNECGKGFAQSNDLKIHIRRHTGEKPYKCDICDEAFICGAKLSYHRKLKQHLQKDSKQYDGTTEHLETI